MGPHLWGDSLLLTCGQRVAGTTGRVWSIHRLWASQDGKPLSMRRAIGWAYHCAHHGMGPPTPSTRATAGVPGSTQMTFESAPPEASVSLTSSFSRVLPHHYSVHAGYVSYARNFFSQFDASRLAGIRRVRAHNTTATTPRSRGTILQPASLACGLQITLAGHSAGGALATVVGASLAASHPDVVVSVVSIGCPMVSLIAGDGCSYMCT